ncbi:YpoC family protein [Radiobacillus sp. PE A8.2]|uniref:YpoC family protein n=1 Tax=Radiobacillus sp. PE A8.2 TaxID=3380349 RepID=UPI00388E23BB
MFDQVNLLIANWKHQESTIAHLFQQRKNQQAIQPIQNGIHNFIIALYALNQFPNQDGEWLEHEIGNFKYKPLNVVERITFIEGQPHHYHSYIQLNELFRELEKLCAKAEVLERL